MVLEDIDPANLRIELRQVTRIPYAYELMVDRGWAFGTIRNTEKTGKSNRNAEIDFEALVWGFYDLDLQQGSDDARLARRRGIDIPDQ